MPRMDVGHHLPVILDLAIGYQQSNNRVVALIGGRLNLINRLIQLQFTTGKVVVNLLHL